MPQLTICPSCSERLEPEDIFCGNCGTNLAERAAAEAPAAPGPGPARASGAADPAPAAVPPRLDGEAPVTRTTPGPGHDTPGASVPKQPGSASTDAAAPAGIPAQTAGEPPASEAPSAENTRPPWQPPTAGHDDGDYGLTPPAAEAARNVDPGDYGLAPPAQAPAARPQTSPNAPANASAPAPATAAPTPRAGVADPRETLLVPETGPEAASERAAEPYAGPHAGTGTRTGPEAAPEAPSCVACGIGAVDGDGYCERCGKAQPRRRDHIEQELSCVAAVTDRGLRHHRNEDAFAVSEIELPDGTPAVIAVVCDGVSSASRPDEASEAACIAASDSLLTDLSSGAATREAMHAAVLAAAESVNSLARGDVSDPETNAPACTFVSAITTGGLLTVGWVGDSRAYWIPDDRTSDHPARLTEDDSWAARMVEAGLLSEEEAYADERAHAITGWLGADAVDLDPHTASFEPDRPGVVVVCTDGLWNYAESAAELAAVVPSDARTRPLRCARKLVGVALDGGGHDNITVAVLPFPTPV